MSAQSDEQSEEGWESVVKTSGPKGGANLNHGAKLPHADERGGLLSERTYQTKL